MENETCYYYSKEVRKEGSINDERIDICEINGEIFELIGVSDEFKKKNKVKSGTMFFIREATIKNTKIIIAQDDTPEILGNSQIQKDYSSFVGDKIVLAIKVDAADTETTNSADMISDKLFGTLGDKVNLKSQMSECSMNQLNLIPFNGTTPNGKVINNGVGNVNLPFDLKNKFDESYDNKILNAIKKKYGNMQGHVDHLLLVLPKDAANYVAYAILDGWVSVYNDGFVLYPTIVIHEIAHNMGFDHSSAGKEEYGDETGVLGYGNVLDNDKKCFNAVKSWDLGWYAGGHKIVDPFQKSFDGQIIGIANYDQREGKYVIIKIEGHDDGNDYYVAFNRKVGMNKGSSQHGQKVIITSKESSKRIDLLSYKEASLSSGEFYAIEKFGGSKFTLVIEINDISLGSSPAYADISISLQDPGFESRKKSKKKRKQKKKKKKDKKKKTKGDKKIRRRLGSARNLKIN